MLLHYMESQYFFGSSRVSLKFLFFWMSALLFIDGVRSNNSLYYFKYLNVYLFGLMIFALGRSILLIERVTDYFLIYSIILFWYNFKGKKIFDDSSNYYFILLLSMLAQNIFFIRIINK